MLDPWRRLLIANCICAKDNLYYSLLQFTDSLNKFVDIECQNSITIRKLTPHSSVWHIVLMYYAGAT